MAVSILDVAKKAGVSKSTVSAVINNLDCVKETTKNRVLEAIRELDYHPNLAARELITSNKMKIGIVMPTYRHSATTSKEMYFPYINETSNYEIVSGVIERLSKTKYGVLTEHLTVDEAPKSFPEFALSRRVTGAILISPLFDKTYLEHLKEYVPFIVQIGNYTNVCDCVYTDFVNTLERSVDYLYTKGHKRIAFINADPISSTTEKRLTGYRNGLSKHGLAFDEGIIKSVPFTALDGYLAFKEIWNSTDDKPTAVICSTDVGACGALRYMHEQGIKAPENVSILVNGNGLPCELSIPTLTVIGRDKNEIAAEAVKMLMWRIENPEAECRQKVLEDYLIERQSVRNIV